VEPACGAALAVLKPSSLFGPSDKLVVVIVCGGNAISDALLEEYRKTAYVPPSEKKSE
jgi:threonine dehydratase